MGLDELDARADDVDRVLRVVSIETGHGTEIIVMVAARFGPIYPGCSSDGQGRSVEVSKGRSGRA